MCFSACLARKQPQLNISKWGVSPWLAACGWGFVRGYEGGDRVRSGGHSLLDGSRPDLRPLLLAVPPPQFIPAAL